MKTDQIRWGNWDAVRCVSADCELVVGVSAGPRILSFRRGAGANLLYEDTTDFRVGEWRLHGGHRFTVAPEGDQTYAPDNEPCLVQLFGNELRILAPTADDGTQRILRIHPASGELGFDVQHLLMYHGPHSWQGALWAITCVPRTSVIVAPGAESGIRFWKEADRTQWQCVPGHVIVQPSGARSKAGWHSEAAWLASLQAHATLVLHCPSPSPPGKCVDEGCNLEIFTCAHYVELETLSGLVTLAPGGHAAHLQRWRWLPPAFSPYDGPQIAERAGCGTSLPELRYAH